MNRRWIVAQTDDEQHVRADRIEAVVLYKEPAGSSRRGSVDTPWYVEAVTFSGLRVVMGRFESFGEANQYLNTVLSAVGALR